MELMNVLGWGSPIGIGLFLVLVALMIFLLTKADEVSKRSKEKTRKKKEE